jgi:hypothetical protein
MKTATIILATALALVVSGQALAHGGRGGGGHGGGGHVRFGISFGVPLFWPNYYYGPPAYYYGPPAYPYYYSPAVEPASPPTYIERGAPAAEPSQPSQSYWYFCRESNAYYPYVKHCPGGWQRVDPQPPPG